MNDRDLLMYALGIEKNSVHKTMEFIVCYERDQNIATVRRVVCILHDRNVLKYSGGVAVLRAGYYKAVSCADDFLSFGKKQTEVASRPGLHRWCRRHEHKPHSIIKPSVAITARPVADFA